MKDQKRHILVCLQNGDYAITEGNDNIHILGTGNETANTERDIGVFTVEFQSRASELFNVNERKYVRTGVILWVNEKKMEDLLTSYHMESQKTDEWTLSVLQPEIMLEKVPQLFWSVVLLANKAESHCSSKIGQSLSGKFSEMLTILLPQLDWSRVLHGDTDGKRTRVDSIKCAEYKKIQETCNLDELD